MSDLPKTSFSLSPSKRRLVASMLRRRGIDLSRSRPIPRRDRSGPLPPSLNQEGLLFVDQLDLLQANSSIPGAVRLRGHLDVAALLRSLSEIVRRHESLRTSFRTDEGGMVQQVISPAAEIELPTTALESLPEAEREAEVQRLAMEEARRPFELARGPLFRARLLRLSKNEHVLLLNVHHVVCDGWSMGVFTRELSALYEAFSQDRPPPLPELPLQFADVALWERERMKDGELEDRLAYWRSRLAGAPPELGLRTDRPRPSAQSMRGRHLRFALSQSLTHELRALSRREGVTLFMVLRAAFDMLLHHETGREDLVVGTSIANRDRPELEGLIGYFVTVLPLRVDLSGNPSFREILGRVRSVTLEATSHALPLAILVRDLSPPRHPGRNPLFQVELTLLTPDRVPAVYGYGLGPVRESISLPGLTLSSLDVEGGNARFDLSLHLWDMPEGIMGTAEFCTDLFRTATVARVLSRFEGVLGHVVAEPDVRLSAMAERLERLDRAERSRGEAACAEMTRQSLRGARRRPIVIGEPR